MKFFFIQIFIFLFCCSCDVVNLLGTNLDESSASNSTNSCSSTTPSSPLSERLANSRRTEKVYLDSNLSLQPHSFNLKNGLEMMVVFDVQCFQNYGTLLTKEKSLDLNTGVIEQLPYHKMFLPQYAAYLKTKTTYDADKLKDLAENDPCILSISNFTRLTTSAVPNDPSYENAEHLDYINAPSAWDQFYHVTTGLTEDIVIAVIDSGGDFDHPDLIDNVWTNPGEIPNNGIDDDSNGFIDDVHGYNFVSSIGDPSPETPATGNNNHGTAVAGLAAARMNNNIGAAGVMGTNMKIMHLNIAGPNTTLDPNGLLNALIYATNNGADVINLSLGVLNADLTAFQPITDVIVNAVNNNVVVVAGAGNDGQLQTDTNYFWPGSPIGVQTEGMITVGSLDTKNGQLSSFSNYGSQFVEMIAPGSEDTALNNGLFILAPGSDPTTSYGEGFGTSYATPIVAGAAGLAISLLRTRGGTPTPAEIENLLKVTSQVDSSFAGQIQGCQSLDLNQLVTGIE